MIILCPLEFERRALRRVATDHGWTLVCTGPGSGPAEWIDRAHVAAGCTLVLAGVAAGLVAPARAGSAWAAGGVVDASHPSQVQRPTWSVLGVQTVTLACVAAPLLDAAAKARVAAQTGASIADMESAAFARSATRAGAHWAIVRGVSDGANDALPASVVRWTNERGGTRLGAVAASLLRSPAMASELVSLGRRSSRAMQAVAQALVAAHNAALP